MRAVVVSFVVGLSFVASQAQVLRLVRTDAVSSSTALTATKLVAFDIIADSVSDVTAVSFELRYSGAQYIRLAAWKPRQLSRNSIYVIDLSDTLSGSGSIHIGVLSGAPSTGPGVSSPTVIHLDFAVTADAPHGTVITFEAHNAEAVIAGTQASVIPLRSEPFTAIIHGFINVYPGDANSDGIVDQRDFSTVALYLGQGGGSVRGFRREPASTLWQPQRALAWDNVQATYADCDGSGDITLADALVVKLNFGKARSISQSNKHSSLQQPTFPSLSVGMVHQITVPLVNVHAVAFALSNVFAFDVQDIHLATPGWHCDFFSYNEQTATLYCIASADSAVTFPVLTLQGVQLTSPHIDQCYALVENGTILPFLPIVSLVEESPISVSCLRITCDSGALNLEADRATVLHIYSIDGRLVRVVQLDGIDTQPMHLQLPSGLYIFFSPECSRTIAVVE